MKKLLLCLSVCIVLASCQHELHFPPGTAPAVVPAIRETFITSIVVTDPQQIDYDSIVFRYGSSATREVHIRGQQDSTVRTYYYDASGRLSMLDDTKAIYFTNSTMAKRMQFHYDAQGSLLQTTTDFVTSPPVDAYLVSNASGNLTRTILYDTAYAGPGYNFDWNNRIIYSTVSPAGYLQYDSGIFVNTSFAGLAKTMVNEYTYASDTSVFSVSKRVYFNNQLAENGTLTTINDRAAPVYSALRKKLYRNLSNWFETGLSWQDDNYRLFPLPGGPYQNITYKGFSTGSASPYTRTFNYNNSFTGDRLTQSVIEYTLAGQGTDKFTYVLRFYYSN